jgi:hypothetical protein
VSFDTKIPDFVARDGFFLSLLYVLGCALLRRNKTHTAMMLIGDTADNGGDTVLASSSLLAIFPVFAPCKGNKTLHRTETSKFQLTMAVSTSRCCNSSRWSKQRRARRRARSRINHGMTLAAAATTALVVATLSCLPPVMIVVAGYVLKPSPFRRRSGAAFSLDRTLAPSKKKEEFNKLRAFWNRNSEASTTTTKTKTETNISKDDDDGSSNTFCLPTMMETVREHAPDESTIAEMVALDESLQRLTAAKEGLFALMQQEQEQSSSSSSNNQQIKSGSNKKTKKNLTPYCMSLTPAPQYTSTTSSRSTEQQDLYDKVDQVQTLEELEELVTQLETQAAASTAKLSTSNGLDNLTMIKPQDLQTISEYEERIRLLEAQVEQIALEHEQTFIQALHQAEQQQEHDASSVSLMSLEEINQRALIKAKITPPDDTLGSFSSPGDNSDDFFRLNSTTSTDTITQEISQFTQDVSQSFALLKAQLGSVLEDVKQDGLELQLKNPIEVSLRLLQQEPGRKGELQKMNLLSKFRSAWRHQVSLTKQQLNKQKEKQKTPSQNEQKELLVDKDSQGTGSDSRDDAKS